MADGTTGPAAQPGTIVDPYRSYTFRLLCGLAGEGHFSAVSGLGVRIETIAYREGGAAPSVRAIPGSVTFPPVTLHHGLTSSTELWEWLLTAMEGRVERRNVSIVMLDPSGTTEVLRWNLQRAWPSEWYGAPLDAMSHDVAIEVLTLVHEGIERDDSAGGSASAAGPTGPTPAV